MPSVRRTPRRLKSRYEVSTQPDRCDLVQSPSEFTASVKIFSVNIAHPHRSSPPGGHAGRCRLPKRHFTQPHSLKFGVAIDELMLQRAHDMQRDQGV
jgi:hypothetical protein